MRRLVVLLLVLVAISAHPGDNNRIVGGSLTTINQYPDMASMLFAIGTTGHRQSCGGSIINNRSILTAAHCTHGWGPANWRTRLGSTFANSGGVLFNTALIINHPQYNSRTIDNDIAIVRVQGAISFTNVIRQGSFAGPNYHVADNQVVWATGWGRIYPDNAITSEQLRHVQIYTINQNICRQRYATIGMAITDNMLCVGVLDVGGRDQCSQDSGGPLYHNGVIVGVCSFGPPACGDPRIPGVNARVQRYANWITQNA